MGSYLVIFVEDHMSHGGHVLLAPLYLRRIIICHCTSQYVLHLSDDFLTGLAMVHAFLYGLILLLLPDSYKSRQILLILRVWQGITQ